jgi:hypothetical protein
LALWDSAYGWFGNTATISITPTSDVYYQAFAVQPNPSRGNILLTGPTSCTLQVCDIYGRSVYKSQNPLEPPATLSLDFLPDGLYLMTVATSDTHQHIKLIIRH